MSLMAHTMRELDLLGLTEDNPSEMNQAMRKHIIHMMEQFCDEGHSGFSAGYAVSLLSKLMKYEPLTALTGEDDEWVDVSDFGNGDSMYQNKRYSKIFKDGKDGKAYNIEGKVFWEWAERPLEHDEPGYPGIKKYKSYFTSRDSKTPVEFPYVPCEPIYEYKESGAE
jgi:hypothetical protein